MMENKKQKILFVCLGNICRSPAAEGIMKKMVSNMGIRDQFTIDSAGTYGGHEGEKADRRMRHAASARGYELTHRSRPLRSDDYQKFDYIIVMDDSNYEDVCRRAPDPESVAKISRMATYLSEHDIDHVPDPYYQGSEGFELVLDILEDGCSNLINKLKK